MDARRARYAEEMHAAGRAHDAERADRLERLRNLEPETAALLGVLIRATRAHSILELGTSNGYSTLWLADAAEATGGRVTSVDVDPARTRQAAQHLGATGLADRVELRTEDAGELLARAPAEVYDFIFLDAERPAYPAYLPALQRALCPGGLLAVDNVISHAEELIAFTALLETEPRFTQTVVPVGAGLRLAVRT